MGLYLAARCLLRKGTVPDSIDVEALKDASALLEEVINDHALAKLHESAHNLLNFISIRTQPDERIVTLAQDVLDPTKRRFAFPKFI